MATPGLSNSQDCGHNYSLLSCLSAYSESCSTSGQTKWAHKQVAPVPTHKDPTPTHYRSSEVTGPLYQPTLYKHLKHLKNSSLHLWKGSQLSTRCSAKPKCYHSGRKSPTDDNLLLSRQQHSPLRYFTAVNLLYHQRPHTPISMQHNHKHTLPRQRQTVNMTAFQHCGWCNTA